LKAVVFSGPGQVEIRDLPNPTVRSGHVLIETHFSAISTGTELLVLDGRLPEGYGGLIKFPLVPGYENVGRIAELGSDITGMQVGDWVVCEGAASFPGVHSCWGGHSEFVLAPVSEVFVLPDAFEPRHGLFTVLTSIAVHAAQRGQVSLGQSVAVLGQGVVGLLAVQVARAMGASEVVAIDRLPQRLEVSTRVGADQTVLVDSCSELEERIRRLAEGRGFDVVIEASGSSSLAEVAPRLCRERGRLVLAGMYTDPVGFDYWDLYTREIDVMASRQAGPRQQMPDSYYRWTWRRTHEESLRLLADGRIEVEPLITHRLPIDEIATGYEALRESPSSTIKVVLAWK
jgi:2-desacetyl-2-hydroxyethyl bacteriochlorophyllide A dehydrogenase